ncbi:MAG: bifunctional hydroxymethylpyrimidine kinase/phosphomethylpyrimidine kinase [Acidobacteria bacterium]|nr:bifunctional hydroxymethylpyrimidine kinase/phosphomethylpyrimidine kinase [Acidobacteriota bacterium]
MKPIALTIAGSDPSGGAGLQADLKTFHQFGLYGMSVVTLLTVQNTRGVRDVRNLDTRFVIAQLENLLEDLPPGGAKTGALGTAETIEAIASKAKGFSFPLVVDPVMVSKHGASLVDPEGAEAFRRYLLRHCYLVTPNRMEATALSEWEVKDRKSMREAARAIAALGPRAVLLKGGHLEEEDATDLLYFEKEFLEFPARRIDTPNTHGTGCTYSAAIASGLARGKSLPESVGAAKRYLTRAIETNPGLGHGHGPVNHHAEV